MKAKLLSLIGKKEIMNYLKSLFLFLTCAFIFGVTIANAQNVPLTTDGKVPGKPFVELQNQIDDLNARLNAIQVNGGIHVYDSSDPPQYLGIFAGNAPGPGVIKWAVFNPTLKLFLRIQDEASSPDFGQIQREYYDIDISGNIVVWARDSLIRLCDDTYVTGTGDWIFSNLTGGYYNPECNFSEYPSNFESWRFASREVQSSEIPFTLPVTMPLHFDNQGPSQ